MQRETKKVIKFFNDKNSFPNDERLWVFLLLMYIGGYFGGFTYSLRGGVFCNAQTGNLVLLAMSIAEKNYLLLNYSLFSLGSYITGIFIAEFLEEKVNKFKFLKWHTLLLFFEIMVTIFLGFVPEKTPYQVSQLAICFITAMQFNTFKKAHGLGMATTFCTNHVRQFSAFLIKFLKNRDRKNIKVSLSHFGMLVAFLSGVMSSMLLGKILLGKSIWFSSILLSLLFIYFFKTDIDLKKIEENE